MGGELYVDPDFGAIYCESYGKEFLFRSVIVLTGTDGKELSVWREDDADGVTFIYESN